ncbi:hypothetical protein VTL71DRAFT_16553 [Oculimacula yallundae]|uniref:Uncharacterized protein n=1 Tax=Oculimacula yallundae TaxID=86028 RepID=A0ABR4CFD4_9HELO
MFFIDEIFGKVVDSV